MDDGGVPVTEYWFARRFKPGSSRSAMAPVSWKGWAVFGAFLVLDLIGTAALAIMVMNDRLWLGVGMFVAMTAIGGGALIYFAMTKGDPSKTVDDYRAERAAKRGSLVQ
jgi:hypothetical protein